MSCVAYLPNGSVDCKVPMADVAGVILTNKSLSLGALAAVYSYSTWKAAVDTALTMYPLRGITDYENTTDDPGMTTSPLTGRKRVTNRPTPSGVFYVDSNLCDFTDMLRNLKGGQYGVILYLRDGKFLVMRNPYTGIFKPIPATLDATTKGFPAKGEQDKQFPVYINFLDADDWENAVLIDPQFDYQDLIAATPAGINMWITTPWASTKAVVRCEDRAGSGHAGFTAPDFVVVGSNMLTTPTVASIMDNTGGSYDLVITKGTSDPLSAGDYVIVQVKDGSGPYTYLSNKLRIQA